MLFPTLQFALFFGIVLLLHRTVPRRARVGILLGASLLFYALWIPPYLLLLLADIGVNYVLLRAIQQGRHRKLWLCISIIFTLGLLGGFKYAMPIATAVAGWWGWGNASPDFLPHVILPLGISFYSFQIVGFAIDTYRREAGDEPLPFSRYALFIAFFPQLIAGPILRGQEMLPQLARGGRVSPDRDRRGIRFLAWGLFKKVVLSDFLLAPFVNIVFLSPGDAGFETHWIAIYAFAFQIYFDFSGYTDMARGLALLLGYELPDNFLEPYLSRGPAEFWRRWHITLSRWLRDYLYIPLGGNRLGLTRTHINLILTMLLGGLWHGAGWTFVAWGAMHGILLSLERAIGWRSERAGVDEPLRWKDAPRIFVFFHLTCLSWVFFRAESLADALDFMAGLFGSAGRSGVPLLPALTVLLCAALHGLERWVRTQPAPTVIPATGLGGSRVIEAAVLGLVLAAVVAASGTGAEFIYFQF